jgi:hypothetical protein
MKGLIISVGLLFFSIKCLATAQSPDFLIYNGDTLSLFSNPLELLYKNDPENRPQSFFKKAKCTSSACWRGYIAYWELIDNKIYLVAIKACCFNIEEEADLNSFFKNKVIDGRVFADWISDELVSPSGKMLHYTHMGYASVFEKEIGFKIERGELIEVKNYDNSKSKFPELSKNGLGLAKFINEHLDKDLFKEKNKGSILAMVRTNEDGKIISAKIETGLGDPFDAELIKAIYQIEEWAVIYRKGKMIEIDYPLTFEIDKKMMLKKKPLPNISK